MIGNKVFLPIAVLFAIACQACGASTQTSSTTSAPRSSFQKPMLLGLVDMGSQLSYAKGVSFPTVNLAELGSDYPAFSGIVVNETWAQLEPSSGTYAWNDLDSSLSAVESFNAEHPSNQLGVKLRIFAGKTAPDWAKQLGGSPITLTSKNTSFTYGRWWSASYRQAWSKFQHALASRYDSNPTVRAVAVTSCATLTGEPFIVGLDPSNIPILESAGWTPQAQQSCIEGVFSDYSGWVKTPIDFPFNPFRILINNRPQVDEAVTNQILEMCAKSKSTGGPLCVVGNHGLSDTATSGSEGVLYSEINSLWSANPNSFSVYFQTIGPNSGADCHSINIAISHHATSVELWPPALNYKGFGSIPIGTLELWNKDLASSTSLSC